MKIRKLPHLLLVFVVASLVLGGAALSAEKSKKDESLRKGEIRATLDPGQFADPRIRKAYQIAKDIPWVLDSIYCYCFCKESPAFKHKSLLSCYVDNHAAVWEICLREALRAFELYEKGYSVKKIKETVEAEFKL